MPNTIFDYITDGNIEEVRKIIGTDKDIILIKGKKSLTPLAFAIAKKQKEIAALLLNSLPEEKEKLKACYQHTNQAIFSLTSNPKNNWQEDLVRAIKISAEMDEREKFEFAFQLTAMQLFFSKNNKVTAVNLFSFLDKELYSIDEKNSAIYNLLCVEYFLENKKFDEINKYVKNACLDIQGLAKNDYLSSYFYEIAEKLFKQKKFQEAEIIYTTMLALTAPEDNIAIVNLQVMIARCYLSYKTEGEVEQCVQKLRENIGKLDKPEITNDFASELANLADEFSGQKTCKPETEIWLFQCAMKFIEPFSKSSFVSLGLKLTDTYLKQVKLEAVPELVSTIFNYIKDFKDIDEVRFLIDKLIKNKLFKQAELLSQGAIIAAAALHRNAYVAQVTLELAELYLAQKKKEEANAKAQEACKIVTLEVAKEGYGKEGFDEFERDFSWSADKFYKEEMFGAAELLYQKAFELASWEFYESGNIFPEDIVEFCHKLKDFYVRVGQPEEAVKYYKQIIAYMMTVENYLTRHKYLSKLYECYKALRILNASDPLYSLYNVISGALSGEYQTKISDIKTTCEKILNAATPQHLANKTLVKEINQMIQLVLDAHEAKKLPDSPFKRDLENEFILNRFKAWHEGLKKINTSLTGLISQHPNLSVAIVKQIGEINETLETLTTENTQLKEDNQKLQGEMKRLKRSGQQDQYEPVASKRRRIKKYFFKPVNSSQLNAQANVASVNSNINLGSMNYSKNSQGQEVAQNKL